MNYIRAISKGRHLFIVTLCLLILPVMLSCQNDRADRTSEEIQQKKAQVNSGIADLLASMDMHHFSDSPEAPDFNLESVSGGRVRLSQYRGKVVLLSFWATW